MRQKPPSIEIKDMLEIQTLTVILKMFTDSHLWKWKILRNELFQHADNSLTDTLLVHQNSDKQNDYRLSFDATVRLHKHFPFLYVSNTTDRIFCRELNSQITIAMEA
jgi:hypothetical protein